MNFWICDTCGQKNSNLRDKCLWCERTSENPQDDIDAAVDHVQGDAP